ncbi:polyhydroxyalkanoic acid system family protein [Sphingosinicella humi]|uniref:Polyhydroxyalkanoic acid synthase n=1 Tax=Allosphingosinicella humi TaxID=2068657 RepID=A0A2U2J1R6_9SPHN|nr:polyhydroxyalkanoic acid system family protein [Sphingosinicella humi]PWG02288.1 polyhydroxyalkanoic acid synthase [Sphingosinicella humi]
MSQPIVINLPHNLGAEEAKRRMQGGIGRLKDHIPGGAADVRSSWEGDRMHLDVRALGQEVTGHIDVMDTKVRLEFTLPAVLALFAGTIEGLLTDKGTELLEDKRPKKG